MSYKQDLKDVTHGTSLVIWALLLCLIVGGAIWFGWMKYGKKTALDLQREAVKHSIQYTESIQAEVNHLISNYNKVKADISKYKAANEGNKYDDVIRNLNIQKGSIKNQIKDRVSHLPESEVPSNVRLIINS
jgi:predicted negative regulator of RcsB-dependent stress response